MTSVIASLLLSTALWPVEAASPRPVELLLRTPLGQLQGSAGALPQIKVYRGIPYAAAPVGPLRWRPPTAAPRWKGVLDATHFGPNCPLVQRPDPGFFGAPKLPQSEACLSVNVWTGASRQSDRLPVFVWIAGGGFREGSGAVLGSSGEHLAAKGAVVVTFNYRVGFLGYLAHPVLSAESPRHVSGNYGMLDMIAALRWVHEHIEAFGGDPSRVTIGGESSGSMSVSLLTVSPLAKGLMQRAIGQSGAALGGTTYTVLKPLSYAESRGRELMETLGAHDLQSMRAIPWQKFVEAQAGAPVGFLDPTIDGYFLPADFPQMYAQGLQSDIPLLIGNTTHEASQMPPVASAADYRGAIQKCFPPTAAGELLHLFPFEDNAGAQKARDSAYDLLLGEWMVRGWAGLAKGSGQAAVYVYRFDQAPPTTPSRGAFHTADLYYSFNNLDLANLPWTPADRALAEEISSYWINFMREGNPNGRGLPAWPAYQADAPLVMQFKQGPLMALPMGDRDVLDALDHIKAAQQSLAPELRCDGGNVG